MKVKGIDLGDIATLAKKAHKGLANGIISVDGAGIDHKQAQRIYRAMKKDCYSGNLLFYICRKVREYFFKDIELEIAALKKYAPEVYEEKSCLIMQERLDELPRYVSFCIEFDTLMNKYYS